MSSAGPFDNPGNSGAQEHIIIKVLNWNIEGLRGALNLTEDNILSRYGICTLTETFMREETAISIQNFYNFHVYAKQTRERGRPSGGITCLIKPHLAPFEVPLKEENLITVQTRIDAIIAAYFNPDRTAVDIVDSLSNAISAPKREQKIILAGDFNCTTDKRRGKTDEVLEFLHMEG
jgi:exonuclease III